MTLESETEERHEGVELRLHRIRADGRCIRRIPARCLMSGVGSDPEELRTSKTIRSASLSGHALLAASCLKRP
jgi:hypothetical protein